MHLSECVPIVKRLMIVQKKKILTTIQRGGKNVLKKVCGGGNIWDML